MFARLRRVLSKDSVLSELAGTQKFRQHSSQHPIETFPTAAGK